MSTTAKPTDAPYGYCPFCGAPGTMRARDMIGTTYCANRHEWAPPPTPHQLADPEIDHFMDAAVNEALHQRERWGAAHDASKTPTDWFWLVGYLAGKALNSVGERRLHHIITTAAALLNWHAQETGQWAQGTGHARQPGHEAPGCMPVKVRGEVRCACEFAPASEERRTIAAMQQP